MYKRPPKHIERARLFALYSLMTFLVIVVVIALVMVVSNYGFNKVTGTLEQRGLVQFASSPSGATVEIDGEALNSRTSTKSSVEPGKHTFAMWREGYETWSMTAQVDQGSLVWLNYIRLVPKNRVVETIRSYDERIHEALTTSDNSAILVQFDPRAPKFRYIDITDDSPSGRDITLPQSSYPEPSKADRKAPAFSMDQWDQSARYVTIWYGTGPSKQLIVVDTRDPSKTVNVSQEFSFPIESAQFSGRSGNILYVVSNGTLRRLNVSEGTASRSLASNVAQFSMFDSDTVTYVTKAEDSSGERFVGVYRDGDKQPIVLRTATSKNERLMIEARTYFDTTYTAIVEGKNFILYRGHHDKGIDGLKVVTSQQLDNDITDVEFNASGSHVLLRTDVGYASYDIDRILFTKVPLDRGLSDTLFWIDTMHLGSVSDNALMMRDVDGTNTHVLNPTNGSDAAILSRNGTYMYSFGKTDEGEPTLQRIRMILR